MSLLKFASMTCIALTLGACQSVFQPAVQKPLAFANDASEQVKAGCTGQDCPLVNIDTLHFPDAPKLDAMIENRLLRMTVNSPDDKLAPSLNAYREHFLRTADSRNSTYLQAKVREQHDDLVIVELSSYLDLQAARIHVDNPRDLRQAQHFAARDIRYMRLADKRQQVVIEAKHMCMMMRGVEKQNSSMITSVMLGEFRENAATRSEFLSLIK